MFRTAILASRVARGLGETVKGAVSVDATTQEVGKEYKYIFSGFPPGSKVVWTSYKNGEHTGELNGDYGHVIEGNGGLILKWTPDADKIGQWIKTALVIHPDGTMTPYNVAFRVVEAAPAISQNNQQNSFAPAGFWDSPLFNLGGFEVTPVMAGVGLAALYLFKGKR